MAKINEWRYKRRSWDIRTVLGKETPNPRTNTHHENPFAQNLESAMSKVTVLESTLNSIFGNLASEEALIAKSLSLPTLFVWRNQPTVTIGRHQNPWKECDLKLMNDHGVALARRYSGGGAVYQDMGCTTFTFIHNLSSVSSPSRIIDANFETLVTSMQSLGLSAERKGRNDIVLGDFKISGSAFKQTPSTLIHHGTILVGTDTERLGKYLTPSKLKLQAKGIASVQARVSTIAAHHPRVDHEVVCDSLARAFRARYMCSDLEPPTRIDQLMQQDEVFLKHHSLLSNWDWRYGTTPHFSHHMETRIEGVGMFECHYEVDQGRISGIQIFSDILFPDVVDQLEIALRGTEYSREAVNSALDRVQLSHKNETFGEVVRKFSDWFIHSLFR